ncbi:PEGA domain-containing protein [Myxococcota bacterium]|nr:PEGA domain-containing protein [Myxococcota bacterium]
MRRANSLACLTLAALATAACKEKVDSTGKPFEVGRFRLHTYPPGAKVWVNGELKVEATPATLVLPEGEYVLRMQAPGAVAIEKTIEVEAGESEQITFNIPKPPEATIAIRSDVVGADVRINGYRRGATPLAAVVTKPGPVDITLTTPTGRAKSIRTTLEIGEQKLIEAFFDPVMSKEGDDEDAELLESRPEPQGFVTVAVKPDSLVYTAEEKVLGESPLVRHVMKPGEHELVLRSLDGRYEKRVTVTVEEDQHAVFRFQHRDEDQLPGWKPPPKDAGPRD